MADSPPMSLRDIRSGGNDTQQFRALLDKFVPRGVIDKGEAGVRRFGIAGNRVSVYAAHHFSRQKRSVFFGQIAAFGKHGNIRHAEIFDGFFPRHARVHHLVDEERIGIGRDDGCKKFSVPDIFIRNAAERIVEAPLIHH